MTTIYETLNQRFDIESIPDAEGIGHRFLADFQRFVAAKKHQAVQAVLRQEIPEEELANSPNLVQAIVDRVDDEALLEKSYIFLSVNPQALV